MHVDLFQDGIANIDADAEANTMVRGGVFVERGHPTLDRYRGLYRAVDAVEYDKQRISRGLANDAAVLTDRRFDELAAQPPQAGSRASVV